MSATDELCMSEQPRSPPPNASLQADLAAVQRVLRHRENAHDPSELWVAQPQLASQARPLRSDTLCSEGAAPDDLSEPEQRHDAAKPPVAAQQHKTGEDVKREDMIIATPPSDVPRADVAVGHAAAAAAPRLVYSKPTLLTLRHDRCHQLPPGDPISAGARSAASPTPQPEAVDAANDASERRVYSKATLLALRHDRRYPLSPEDPICATPPSFLSEQPAPQASDIALSSTDATLSFASFALPEPLLRALHDQGITTPSPIQVGALPAARMGMDLVAQAKSGTGKTLVFALASLEAAMSTPSASPAALLLAPSRELVAQICEVVNGLGVHLEPRPAVLAVVGGVPEREDAARLGELRPGVIIGTPGRLLALVRKGLLNVDALRLLVLDEADRLLSGALGDAVPTLCTMLSPQKQTLAFSATFPVRLQRLLAKVMRSPRSVQVGDEPVPGGSGSARGTDPNRKAVLLGVQQRKVALYPGKDQKGGVNVSREKTRALTILLAETPFSFCMVFTNDKLLGGSIAMHLRREGFKSMSINANMRQKERVSVMKSVRKGTVHVLVATDLLARGVDLKSCDLVVHLDVPTDSATYLHRVGRAGRFGKHGLSVVMYSGDEEEASVGGLERVLGFRMKKMHIESALRAADSGKGLQGRGATRVVDGSGTQGEDVDEAKMEDNSNPSNHLGMDEMDTSDGGCLEDEAQLNVDNGVDEAADGGSSGFVVDAAGKDEEIDDSWVPEDTGEGLDGLGDARARALDQLNEIGAVADNAKEYASCAGSKRRRVEVDGVGAAEAEDWGLKRRVPDLQSLNIPAVHAPVLGPQDYFKEGGNGWDAYAAKAYNEGYREAYERAYRIAKQLRERLGWVHR